MDSLYEAIRSALNTREPYARQFDIAIDEVSHGYAKASMPFDDRHRNAFGQLHDSVVYTLADMAFGGVLWQEGVVGVTLNAHVCHIAPGLKGPIVAEARSIAANGKLSHIEVRISDGTGALVATVQVTGYKTKKKVQA